MSNINNGSRLANVADVIAFPIRALFLQDDGLLGLSSLRDERMRVVSDFCKGKVLDVGCGPGNIFIGKFIGPENGIGVDSFPYEGVENLIEDFASLPFDDESFDTVTLIAVGGHIPRSRRAAEFQEFARVLKPGGRLIVTEGEPITQFIHHQWIAFFYRLSGKIDMDSERHMEKEEEYCMPKEEILLYLNAPPLRLVRSKRFMWGLNNVYVAEKTPGGVC